jgi:hypothetical protein
MTSYMLGFHPNSPLQEREKRAAMKVPLVEVASTNVTVNQTHRQLVARLLPKP